MYNNIINHYTCNHFCVQDLQNDDDDDDDDIVPVVVNPPPIATKPVKPVKPVSSPPTSSGIVNNIYYTTQYLTNKQQYMISNIMVDQ